MFNEIDSRTQIEINIKNFTLSGLLDFGRWEVFAYGDLKINEYDVKAELILRKLDTKEPIFFAGDINLDMLYSFPLSRIIENKKLTNHCTVNDIQSFKFNISQAIRLRAKDVLALNKFIDKLPNSIKTSSDTLTINAKNKFSKQWILKLKCMLTNKTVFVPEYEIFRHFYLTSSSMSRAIMRSTPQSLYKDIHIDKDKVTGNIRATLILNNNAKNNDAVNIFRFATEDYAMQQWRETRVRLTANRIENKVTYIGASIPYDGIVNMTMHTKSTGPNSYVGYFIAEEDTPYGFDELTVLRHIPPKKTPINVEKPKTITKHIPENPDDIEYVTDEVPHSSNIDIYIGQDSEEYEPLHCIKKGLDGKVVKHNHVNVDKLPGDGIKTSQTRVSINSVSPNSTSQSGHEQTAPAQVNPVNNTNTENDIDEDDEVNKKHIERKSITLNNFRDMIVLLKQELDKKYNNISINISHDCLVPLKTKKRETIERADKIPYLNDESRRKYVSVIINFENSMYCILEIERDKTIMPSLSTVILKNVINFKNNTIQTIVQNFVDNGGKWPEWNKYGADRAIYIKHPLTYDKIEDWADKIIYHLEQHS